MTHRIVVVGAGYAGLTAAVRAAGQLRSAEARVTLVNAAAGLVERVRLHQVAAGQRVPDLALRDALRGTGVEFVLGRVRSVDPDGAEVWIDEPDGPHVLGYDTLVYALGSMADVQGVAGVSDHALTVAGFDDAKELSSRVSALAAEGAILGVVGGGATGIEVATELAESYPSDVRDDAKVVEVHPDGVVLADSDCVGVDAVLWTTGFRVPSLARDAGLSVDGHARVLVDDTLRSLSHPNVYAVGDAAVVRGPDGRELRMACATAIPAGRRAADAIVSRLAGRGAAPLRFRYLVQCLSLGRRDGVIQFLHADDSPRDGVLTGRAAALFKEAIVRGAAWTARRPGPLSEGTSRRRC
ncbi:MAG: NAD(P)/FAD-dependent oxidoreductase [Pseudonocardiaceae bacterium]